MSRGKYSPSLPKGKQFIYNCYGKPPAEWSKELKDQGVIFNTETMFANYDDEGFDSYGYSAFDTHGEYVGIGLGIDRLGYTEFDYLIMDDDEWFEKS